MKYVLDASVGLKTVLPEQDSDKADALILDFTNGIHELITPDTYPIEVAHSLSRAGRRGVIPNTDVSAKMRKVMKSIPVLHSYLPLLPRALDISNDVRIEVYDCLYVALAEREQCELVTADERLTKSLQGDFPFLVLLADIP